MSKEQPLAHRLYFSPMYTELARAVGYAGFPVCDLAERLRPLTRQYGAGQLSTAFYEVLSFAGNRVMLSPKARGLCFGLLGPPPEKRQAFWERVHPDRRPEGWDAPPEKAPDREIDPITDGLRTLTATQLRDRLDSARRHRRSRVQHIADLAKEQVPRVESEMLRRGMDVPETEEPAEEGAEKPPRKAAGKPPRKRKAG
jgi:hypothetical protein